MGQNENFRIKNFEMIDLSDPILKQIVTKFNLRKKQTDMKTNNSETVFGMI